MAIQLLEEFEADTVSVYEDNENGAEVKYDTFAINLEKAIQEALNNRLELAEVDLDIKLQEIQVNRAKRVRELSGNISAYYDVTGVSTIGSGSLQELFESSNDPLPIVLTPVTS